MRKFISSLLVIVILFSGMSFAVQGDNYNLVEKLREINHKLDILLKELNVDDNIEVDNKLDNDRFVYIYNSPNNNHDNVTIPFTDVEVYHVEKFDLSDDDNLPYAYKLKVREVLGSYIKNTNESIYINYDLILEWNEIRKGIGQPIKVTSWYRHRNNDVWTKTSQHSIGNAIDMRLLNYDKWTGTQKLADFINLDKSTSTSNFDHKLSFGTTRLDLSGYYGNVFVHVDNR